MIEALTTLARPYAQAAFEYALKKKALASWDNMLQNAAALASHEEMKALLSNPEVSSRTSLDLFFDILGPVLDEKKCNFLALLSEYKRLPLLPEILKWFTQFRNAHEKTLDVTLISAVPVTPEYQQMLEKRLSTRLKKKIALTATIDPALIGGAIVRAGDKVWDGTIRGKLNRLLESL